MKGHLFASDLSLFAFYVTKRKRMMNSYFANVMECKVYDILYEYKLKISTISVAR